MVGVPAEKGTEAHANAIVLCSKARSTGEWCQ